jgi:hypothetical protein
MRWRVARPLVFVSLWIAALSGAGPAGASMGVSIDVGRIDVSEDLAPGGDYRLPAFGVRNPGTEPTTYKLVVSYIDGQDAGRPAEAWFTFEPAELTLQPGESRPVQARLTLPVDSEPGAYAALIGPQIVSEGGGAQVGAAAAARLTFEVAPSSGWDAFLRWFSRLIAEQPAILVMPGAALLLLVLWVLRRRFSISIARRD